MYIATSNLWHVQVSTGNEVLSPDALCRQDDHFSIASFVGTCCLQAAEEVKFEPKVMVDVLDRRQTLHQAQLENGDILIIQQAISPVRGSRCMANSPCQLPSDAYCAAWLEYLQAHLLAMHGHGAGMDCVCFVCYQPDASSVHCNCIR